MLALRKLAPGPGSALVEVAGVPLAAGEVRLAIEAVGICGTDLHIVDWHGGYEAMSAAMPVTLGHEIAARVVEGAGIEAGRRVIVRPSVTCSEPCRECGGAREDLCRKRTGIGIFRDGGFAATTIAPARNCLSVPDHLSAAHAALTEPLTVSHEAVRNAALIPGDRVLILGPGPIGLGAALFAREAGAEVVIAGRDDGPRLAAARALGFEEFLDVGDKPLADALREAHLPLEYQAIIEATGVPAVLQAAQERLARWGRLVVAGIHPRAVPVDVTRLVRAHQSLIGSYRAPVSAWPTVIAWIAAHPRLVEGLISTCLPLSAIDKGFELMRRKAAVKVIIEPGHD